MSLYRIYRPQTFGDVVGQRHIVSTLENAVAQDKIAHAYLFAGSRGTGKTSVARILAKHFLTRGIEDEQRKKLITDGVEDGTLVDLNEIDAASNRGIDDIRSLLEKIQFAPAIAGAKVYIIDEAHMLTKEAFNALLKTLEEPPPYAYFILATTELHKIPPTIQSRCQRFLFHAHTEQDLIKRMKFVAEKEGIVIEEGALTAIAHHVAGGMRDALSLLDQLRALETITLNDVKERIGETGHEYVEAILDAVLRKDAAGILEYTRKMEEAAVPFETFLRLLLGAVREQLHAAIDAGKEPRTLLRTLDALLIALRDVRIAPVPGLVVESALLSLCDGAPSTPTPTPAIQQTSATAPRIVTPDTHLVPTPISPHPNPNPNPNPLSLDAIAAIWPEVQKKTEPASARMSLKNGQVRAIEGSTIIVRFSSAFHRDKVTTPDASRNIETLLSEALGQTIILKCVLETDEQLHTAAAAESVNMAEAALEIF